MLDGRFNVYIGKLDGQQTLRLASEVGRRLPAHATALGKAMLADLDPDELAARLRGVSLETYTRSTLRTVDELIAELAQVRNRGFATDNEEYTVGVRCVAASIRDAGGHTVAAISVSAPMVRLDRSSRLRARDLIVAAAAEVSQQPGHIPTPRPPRSRPAR